MQKGFFPELSAFVQSDVVVGMELVKENAVEQWRQLIGPTNSLKAKTDVPNSLRALFGTDGQKNAVHGSDSLQSMKREMAFWFGESTKASLMKTTALLNNCSLCIIKPHIVNSG